MTGIIGRSAVAVMAAMWPSLAAADTGLQLPRFASLRADKVNLRAGPGQQYPIDWIFRYRGMPVKIIAEYDHWRQVRDWEGTEGWIHKSLLSGRRTAIVVGQERPLLQSPVGNSTVVARVEGRVVGRILDCKRRWCRLDIGDYRGWMQRSHLWGADPAPRNE